MKHSFYILLTLFIIDCFGAVNGWGEDQFSKICHTFLTLKKTLPKEDSKIYAPPEKPFKF